MKNLTNCYLVLSVANIRAMLDAALLEQQVRGTSRESVTIVLEGLTVLDVGDAEPQIASWSVMQAVQGAERMARLDLAIDNHESTAGLVCLNHSDAAI